MEENKVERPLMSQDEFEKHVHSNKSLKTFESVKRFKSVNRAIKKGHVTYWGTLIPKRPFNNRANSSNRIGIHSRKTNEEKKQIYEQIKGY